MKLAQALVATAFLAATASAFAATDDQAARPLTRAEVKQAVLQARAAGELTFGDTQYPAPLTDTAASSVDAKALRQDAIAARKASPYAATGEAGADIAAWDATSARSTLTRAQVHAQVLAARAAGQLDGPGDDVDYPERALMSAHWKQKSDAARAAIRMASAN